MSRLLRSRTLSDDSVRGLPSTQGVPSNPWASGRCQPPHAWPECYGRVLQMQKCSWQFVACPDDQTLAAFSLQGIGFASGARPRLRAWKQQQETAIPGISSAVQAEMKAKNTQLSDERAGGQQAHAHHLHTTHPRLSLVHAAGNSPEPGRAAQHRQDPSLHGRTETRERDTEREGRLRPSGECQRATAERTLLRSGMPAYLHGRLGSGKTANNSTALLTGHKNTASRLQRLIPESPSILLTHGSQQPREVIPFTTPPCSWRSLLWAILTLPGPAQVHRQR